MYATTIHEWAELIRAVAWPIVALVAVFLFRDVIEQVLRRVTKAEAMGIKLTLEKLGSDLPKAELEIRKVKTPLPEVPKPRTKPPSGGEQRG